MVEVTPQRVTGEWQFLRTISERSTQLAGRHRMHVERGRKVLA
jgi:alkaline phosphatase D